MVLVGRSDRTVKIGSKRLDLDEVEGALKALPSVKDAIVLPHSLRGDGLAAIVVSDDSPIALRSALAARIATWKIPDRILKVNEFPVTPRGKPDTRRLKALL
jgi:acyl-coenzyme A synthetase/AMP-(fatty) acid ligase